MQTRFYSSAYVTYILQSINSFLPSSFLPSWQSVASKAVIASLRPLRLCTANSQNSCTARAFS